MKLFFPCLTILVASTGHVLAGSRVFQPKLSAAHLDRRSWVFDKERKVETTWPNRQIRYCFENDEAADVLREPLEEAHELWQRSGLGAEFTIAEVGEQECQEHPQSTLLVLWTGDDGKMGTTIGLPKNKRPHMLLTTSIHKGMLDQVLNFAHELGHAWGLMHEHQNPNFWSSGTIDHAKGGTVFGPENHGNWRCENLKDYKEQFGIQYPVRNPGYDSGFGPSISPADNCKSYDYATQNDFSAGDYLPMPSHHGIGGSEGKTGDDVDWDSIMLYPSGAGGVGEASPGFGNDHRAVILLKHDGNRIEINDAPSQQDIAAMHSLYGRDLGLAALKLLQKAGGRVTSDFRRLFPESSGEDGYFGCL